MECPKQNRILRSLRRRQSLRRTSSKGFYTNYDLNPKSLQAPRRGAPLVVKIAYLLISTSESVAHHTKLVCVRRSLELGARSGQGQGMDRSGSDRQPGAEARRHGPKLKT